ncbi:MAG: hypothetical protein SOZ89_05630 [Peptoniphilaceae bacterium]|nr:hypothetical protein [Peptoniphilaceae bacterium]MDY3738585.1 hypothetical protein [Peptoniphilaceae bacterium]
MDEEIENEFVNDKKNTEEILHAPKIILSSFSTDKEFLKENDEFTLFLSMYNSDYENTIYNLKVSVEALGNPGVFISDGNTNVYYISEIYPQNYAEINSYFKVMPNVNEGSYPVKIRMEYDDYLGNSYREIQNISLGVFNKSNLKISKVDIKDKAYVGENLEVKFSVINDKKSPLEDINIKISGDNFKIKSNKFHIENLKENEKKDIVFLITPEKKGSLNGNIKINFSDYTGENHEKKLSFKTDVNKKYVEVDSNGNATNLKTGKLIENEYKNKEDIGLNFLFAFIFLLLLSLFIIKFIFKKTKKKN